MKPITEFSLRDRWWRLRYAFWMWRNSRCRPVWAWEAACMVPTDMMDECPKIAAELDLSNLLW